MGHVAHARPGAAPGFDTNQQAIAIFIISTTATVPVRALAFAPAHPAPSLLMPARVLSELERFRRRGEAEKTLSKYVRMRS